MSARSYRRSIAFLIPLMFVILVATDAEAAVGSETFVIVGGAQEPAKNYTWTGWVTGSSNGCNTPGAQVEVRMRWFLDEVQSTRVFIDNVWISLKSTRSFLWDNVQLIDANGNHVKSTAILQNKSADTWHSKTFQYDRWVAISTTSQIQHWNIIIMNNRGSEAIHCHGERHAVDLLRRR